MGIAGRRVRYVWGASFSSKDDEVLTKCATVTGTRRAVQSKPRLKSWRQSHTGLREKGHELSPSVLYDTNMQSLPAPHKVKFAAHEMHTSTLSAYVVYRGI